MLWFFERNDEVAQLETRFDNETAEYVAVIRWPDGHEDVGRSADAASYRTLLLTLEQQLEAAHWHRDGPPVISPRAGRTNGPRDKDLRTLFEMP